LGTAQGARFLLTFSASCKRSLSSSIVAMKTNTDDSMRHHAEDENARGKGNKADTEDDGPA
jgi:hypothetical protein